MEDVMTLQYLEEFSGGFHTLFTNLYSFAISVSVENPKLLFQATGHEFRNGQTIDGFIPTTEEWEQAKMYLTDDRRIVTLILLGSPEVPAPLGVFKFGIWNEIILPPESYAVEEVNGDVVTLRSVLQNIPDSPAAFAERIKSLVKGLDRR
jgi:hypothetical protein